MRMEQMIHYLTVCEEKNFGRASSKLNMAQQTLSNSIKSVEQTMNDELLIRSHKGIEKTYKGEIVYKYFQEIVALYGQLMDEINNSINELGREEITIGTICGAAQNILPEFQGEMYLSYPRVRLNILQGDLNDIIDGVQHKRIDLGLIHILSGAKKGAYPQLPREVICLEQLYRWQPYVWLGANNTLSRKNALSITNAQKYPIMTYSQSDPGLMQKFVEMILGDQVQVKAYDNLKTVAKLVESTSFLFFDWYSESYGLNCQLFFNERAVKAIPVVLKDPVQLDTVAIYHRDQAEDTAIHEAIRILLTAAKKG